MFQIAVIGPQFADRLGIVRQCIECRAAQGADAPPCPGFGPGCLVTPHAQERTEEVKCETAT
jgi:hypothetical protein